MINCIELYLLIYAKRVYEKNQVNQTHQKITRVGKNILVKVLKPIH